MHDHPLWLALSLTCTEGFHHLQTLECLCLTLNRTILVGCCTQLVGKVVEVNALEHVLNRLSTHHGDELVRIFVREQLVVGVEVVDDVVVLFFREEFTIEDVLVGILSNTCLNDDVTLVVDDSVEFLSWETKKITNLVRQ